MSGLTPRQELALKIRSEFESSPTANLAALCAKYDIPQSSYYSALTQAQKKHGSVKRKKKVAAAGVLSKPAILHVPAPVVTSPRIPHGYVLVPVSELRNIFGGAVL